MLVQSDTRLLACALTCVQSCVLRGECRLQASPRAADGDASPGQPSPASVAADHAEATSAMQGASSPPASVKVKTPEILRLAGSVRMGA